MLGTPIENICFFGMLKIQNAAKRKVPELNNITAIGESKVMTIPAIPAPTDHPIWIAIAVAELAIRSISLGMTSTMSALVAGP